MKILYKMDEKVPFFYLMGCEYCFMKNLCPFPHQISSFYLMPQMNILRSVFEIFHRVWQRTSTTLRMSLQRVLLNSDKLGQKMSLFLTISMSWKFILNTSVRNRIQYCCDQIRKCHCFIYIDNSICFCHFQ